MIHDTSDTALTVLHSRLEQGQVVVVAGAGVSIAATGGKAPGWGDLLRGAVSACEERGLLNADQADRKRADLDDTDVDGWIFVASFVEKKLCDRGDFGSWLYTTLAPLEATSPELVLALAQLECPVLTTNYDGLLEAVTGWQRCTWRDKEPMARALRREPPPRIVHLHGYFEEPDTVALGFQGYERIGGNEALQVLQKTLAVGRSMLFVGCGAGATDPNLGQLLAWYRATFPNESEHRHFMLVKDSEVEPTRAHFRAVGVRIAVIGFGAGHDDLPGFVRDLARHAPGQKEMLLGSYRERDAGARGPSRDAVRSDIDESRLSKARAEVEAALEDVSRALVDDPDSVEHRRRQAELRSQRATILILLGDREGARSQLQAVQPELLDGRFRADMALGLSALGAREAARTLLAGAEGDACQRAARQMDLEEDPGLLSDADDERLHIVAATALAARDRRGEAGRIAMEVLRASDAGPPRMRLMVAALVRDWLILSASEIPESQPSLPPNDRAEAIDLIDAEIVRLGEIAWEGPARQMVEELRG